MSAELATIRRDLLETWARKLLARQGMFAAEATLLIDQFNAAETLGAAPWGWVRLPRFVEAFDQGAADPRARMSTVPLSPDHLRLAGGMGCGPVATLRAIQAVCELARTGSVVLVEVVNSFAGLPPQLVHTLVQKAQCSAAYATRLPGVEEHPRPTQVVQYLVAGPQTPAGQQAAQARLDKALREVTGEWVTTSTVSTDQAGLSAEETATTQSETVLLSAETLLALQQCGASSRVPLVLDEVTAVK